MIKRLCTVWAILVQRFAWVILAAALLLTVIAARGVMSLSVSTSVDALMPEGARSVQALEEALTKTGSYASIQVVVETDDPADTLATIQAVQSDIQDEAWVDSTQFYEDIKVLEEHKLLLLDTEDLLQLEADVNEAIPVTVAQRLADSFGTDFTINIRGDNMVGSSQTQLDTERITQLQNAVTSPVDTRKYFVSEDEKTGVLIVWPKPGYDSLGDSRRMVNDARRVLNGVISQTSIDFKQATVAGRIASQVGQFDAIINDLKLGLLTSVILIALIIVWSYRTLMAIPVIFIPLFLGITWTMGLTAATIGNLNLITVFLTLILFGLGIDFGIHNFSRYREERRKGADVREGLYTIFHHTGSASFIAAMTTSVGFFALMLTEFRAFTEFGFIAGCGIIAAFLAMYTVLPALLVVCEQIGWQPGKLGRSKGINMRTERYLNPLRYKNTVIGATLVCIIFACIFAPRMPFEQNLQNLEAQEAPASVQAKQSAREILRSNNSKAIMVVETQEELAAITEYFENKIEQDTDTPTIRKVSSILNFVPDGDSQARRLEVIRRLEQRARDLRALDPEKFEASRPYLTAGELTMADLPPVLRRTYLGTGDAPGYLLYIENDIDLDDRVLARQFYEDAGRVTLDGQTYYSAAQDFIFVEMLALMKADSIKAMLLVSFATLIMVFLFVRSVLGTLIILTPPALGIFITVGIMGAFGPALSIMNMVILPSLVGISVDNGIHIFHRFDSDRNTDDIPRIMNTTGRAAVLTTLTTLIGFGGMITASMGGLRSMAALAIIGFLACLVVTWMLLPVLLHYYGRRQKSETLAG